MKPNDDTLAEIGLNETKCLYHRMLKQLINNNRSDKNTTHSYLEVYELFLQRIKDSATNVMEIGIWAGGGLLMFRDYFPNATVYGLDIITSEQVEPDLKNAERIKLLLSIDAYTPELINLFKTSGKKFDMIVDDGPHTLESMLFFIKLYSTLLTDDGILVVEDIPDYEWTQKMLNELPPSLVKSTFIIDRRHVNGRYDDIMLFVDKGRTH